MDYFVAPAVPATQVGAVAFGILGGITNTNGLGAIVFKVRKRAAPTVTTYSVSGTPPASGVIRYDGADRAITIASSGETSAAVINNTGGTLPAGANAGYCQYTADAEL